MSTYYRPKFLIPKGEILTALKEIGVQEDINDSTRPGQFCISDGKDYLWCYMSDNKVNSFARYGQNYGAERFLEYVENTLGIEIYSEHEEEYGRV